MRSSRPPDSRGALHSRRREEPFRRGTTLLGADGGAAGDQDVRQRLSRWAGDGQWDRQAATLTSCLGRAPGQGQEEEGVGGWDWGQGSTLGVTGHLLVQGAPRGSVRALKYPMRHWQTGEPMVLEWLLAGHGWQDPSPDRGLKVP